MCQTNIMFVHCYVTSATVLWRFGDVQQLSSKPRTLHHVPFTRVRILIFPDVISPWTVPIWVLQVVLMGDAWLGHCFATGVFGKLKSILFGRVGLFALFLHSAVMQSISAVVLRNETCFEDFALTAWCGHPEDTRNDIIMVSYVLTL